MFQADAEKVSERPYRDTSLLFASGISSIPLIPLVPTLIALAFVTRRFGRSAIAIPDCRDPSRAGQDDAPFMTPPDTDTAVEVPLSKDHREPRRGWPDGATTLCSLRRTPTSFTRSTS
jgi:hypothetical protein